MNIDRPISEESRRIAAAAQLRSLAQSIETFHRDTGGYPNNASGLSVLLANPTGDANWRGPYFAATRIPDDPWRRPYLYSFDDGTQRYTIMSLAKDQALGGTGLNSDIVVQGGLGLDTPQPRNEPEPSNR